MAESKEDKKKKKTDISTLKEDIKKIKDSNIIKDKDKEIVKRIDRFFKDFEDVVDEKDKKKAVKNFKEKTFRSLDKNDLKTYIGKPKKEFLLIDEKYNQNVEPAYFWVLGFMRDDLGIKDVQKLIDTYSASEASAFAKSMGQSLGAIQDRVTQNMRSIGQLLKELFQMVREIRILDEKVMLYEEGLKMGNVRENSAEITLKGQYIDLVEGGATSPSSIYGLATKVGFSLLPDLFFRTHVFEPEEVGKIVQQLKFNEKVKEVLARKLRAYAGWRKTTYQTLSHRRNFMVKYLRQHYNAIKLNMQWLKPYLKTMQRLEQKPGAERKPDLIAAVEQAFMEIELFATIKKFGKYNAITDVNFTFRTNPEMMYDAQMQYRKPSHTGRIDMSFKSRVMTDDQVAAYRILIEEEDFELLKSISSSIEEAMDALGDDLKKYLEEAGEKFEKPEPKTKEEKSKITVAEPFVEVFRGFKEIGKSFGIRKPEFKEKKTKFFEDWESDNNFKEAVKTATGRTFTIYWVYKKSHRMVTW